MYVLPSWRYNYSFIPPLCFCACQALARRNVSISTGPLGTLVHQHSSAISFANPPEAFLLGLPGTQGPVQPTLHFRTVFQSFPFNSSGARIFFFFPRLELACLQTFLPWSFSCLAYQRRSAVFVDWVTTESRRMCWIGITRAFHLSLLWKGSVES